MKRLLADGLLPLTLIASTGVYAVTVQAGGPTEWVVAAIAMGGFCLGWWLEHHGAALGDRSGRETDRTDLISAAVMVLLADPLSKIALALAVPGLRWLLPAGFDGVAALPLWLQVAVALLVIEFGKYWSHRLHHAWPWLWCLHAHHHAPERLYTLNGLRFHPLNHWINQALGVLPALLLGVSADAVLGYLALTWPIVLLQHADLRTRPRWLNGILATPASHIWHHSASPHDGQRNFGNALLLWDRVFGTYRDTVRNAVPDGIGLFPESRKRMPGNGYFQQLWWCGPWRR